VGDKGVFMGIRSQRTIYNLLEQYLKQSDEPLTCTELMDVPDIRSEALTDFGSDVQVANNKLSDTLGFMWRKGLLTRYPAPAHTSTFARYAYAWAKRETPVAPAPPVIFPDNKSKQSFIVSEYDGGIVIEFDKFTVVVKPK
jgi:hypothetical protein